MDESPKQLIGETKIPIATVPGKIAKYDMNIDVTGYAILSWTVSHWLGSALLK